jgi:hypothetical protein
VALLALRDVRRRMVVDDVDAHAASADGFHAKPTVLRRRSGMTASGSNSDMLARPPNPRPIRPRSGRHGRRPTWCAPSSRCVYCATPGSCLNDWARALKILRK